MTMSVIIDLIEKKPSQYYLGERRYLWWKASETFHFSERPHGFGEIVGENLLELRDGEVEELLASPDNFGLSDADCEMLRAAPHVETEGTNARLSAIAKAEGR
jgi:hypothetical protein